MREKQDRGRENAEGKEAGNFKQGGQSRLNKETSEQRFTNEEVSHEDGGGGGWKGRKGTLGKRDNETMKVR